MKELNPLFVLNNKTFRETIFFEKNKVFLILFLSIFSTAIYTSFPLITQFYIRYLYNLGNLDELLLYTILFTIIYIIKLIIDIKVEKFEIKFFLILERNIKQKIVKKYSKDLNELLKLKKYLFTKDLGLFILLTKTIYRNILDFTKILIIGVIIFFYDINLFYYFLISIPFFFVFYFLIKRDLLKRKDTKKAKFESDFAILLNKLTKLNPRSAKIIGFVNLKRDCEKKIITRTSHIKTTHIVNSFVNFYRLFYLAYFGVLILTNNISIAGLIVGLLFLTMLMRAITNILKSVPFYSICSNSFFKITSLMKGDNN